MNDIKAQFLIFLAFVFVGMCVSLLYVATHFTRRMKILGDIVFGLAFIGGLFAANLFLNGGQFRFFVFFGVALGWLLGAKTIAPPLDRLLNKLYNLVTDTNGKSGDEKHDIPKQKTDLRGDNLLGDIVGDAVLARHPSRTKRRFSKKS